MDSNIHLNLHLWTNGGSFNSCHCCIVDDVADVDDDGDVADDDDDVDGDVDGDVADGDDDDDVVEDEKIIPPLRGGPSVLT